jgi:alpha-D-xyloside xylohydrolase
MAESLRGGLSLSLCGFGFWSHDIGGFEGLPPAAIYKRWVAYGLLSSHSRLHGSSTYRVPWNYDDEACDVLRFFTKLKCRLMPYLFAAAVEAHREGVPTMRPMVLAFPDDPACDTLDRQYLLGPSLLVAPVLTEDGTVDFHLPAGRWTNLLTGAVVEGGRWLRERHGFLGLPLYVREGSILAIGACETRPDYDFADGVTFRVHQLADGATGACVVHDLAGRDAIRLEISRSGPTYTAVATPPPKKPWSIQLVGVPQAAEVSGGRAEQDEAGIMVAADLTATEVRIRTGG